MSTPFSESSSRQGFVYVLSHDIMPGLLKIGATRKHPLQRMKELAAGTGVPGEFSLVYYRDFNDCFTAETLVHEQFEALRYNQAREFFEADIDQVVAFINKLDRSSEYQLQSQGCVGGSAIKQNNVANMRLPWSELFATFPDDGTARSLTAEEQQQCQALSRS